MKLVRKIAMGSAATVVGVGLLAATPVLAIACQKQNGGSANSKVRGHETEHINFHVNEHLNEHLNLHQHGHVNVDENAHANVHMNVHDSEHLNVHSNVHLDDHAMTLLNNHANITCTCGAAIGGKGHGTGHVNDHENKHVNIHVNDHETHHANIHVNEHFNAHHNEHLNVHVNAHANIHQNEHVNIHENEHTNVHVNMHQNEHVNVHVNEHINVHDKLQVAAYHLEESLQSLGCSNSDSDYLFAYLQSIHLNRSETAQIHQNLHQVQHLVAQYHGTGHWALQDKEECVRLLISCASALNLTAVFVDTSDHPVDVLHCGGDTHIVINLNDHQGHTVATIPTTASHVTSPNQVKTTVLHMDMAASSAKTLSDSGKFVAAPVVKLPKTATEDPLWMVIGFALMMLGGLALIPAMSYLNRRK